MTIFHVVGVSLSSGERPLALPPNLVLVGQAGVDVFFVLSGVIITLTGRGLSPAAFAAKRVRRVLPLWWITALPILGLLALRGETDWREALATVTLWPVTDQLAAPVQVGWTLSFEALFYTAFALILWRPALAWVLLAGYAAALATRVGPLLQFLGNPLILEFLMGVGIAFLPRWRRGIWMIPIGLAIMVLAAPSVAIHEDVSRWLAGEGAWRRVAVYGLPAALVVWGALQINAKPGVLAKLGDASYSLYLFHPPVVLAGYVLLQRLPWLPNEPAAIIVLAACVLLSWRVHQIIEKPILAFLSRRRVAPVAA